MSPASTQRASRADAPLFHQIELMYCGRVPTLTDPPPVLRLAGHPVRWRLLGELARSDRTVRELTDLVGEPQNLVSYHLGKLRAAGLVTSRRSSADGRDAYQSLDLARTGSLLAEAGGLLHPGLRLVPPPPGHPPARPARVLFICTGNSARSQMAEAFARHRSAGAVDACSAGSNPKPVHPEAVRIMRDEHGIDISAQSSKHLDVFARRRFDRVVTLCDRAREACPEHAGHPGAAHWSIADPTAGEPGARQLRDALRRTAAELDTRVAFLLETFAPPATAA